MFEVAVNIVTWNSADYIQICLDAVLRQTYPNISVTVLDNGSSDETVACFSPYLKSGIRLIRLPCNVGYAAAHNRLIRATDSDYVLTLNPDAYLTPRFIECLVTVIEEAADYGSASGRLLSVSREQFLANEFAQHRDQRIDEAGMGIQRSRRQYARGYQHLAAERCTEPSLIFGPCGASAFYRRAMLEDISVNGEYFDEAFFVHKEDVDIAWRAQLLGWRSCYTPQASGYHVRTFHPGQRKNMPTYIRRHAIKNRWLMAIKNESLRTLLPDILHITLHDMKILGYLLLFEQDSLPAFFDLIRLLPRALAWRRIIQARIQTDAHVLRRWFSECPE